MFKSVSARAVSARQQLTPSSIRRYLLQVCLLAAAYFVLGWLSFQVSVSQHIVTQVIFAAEGVSLAAVLLWGFRIWPGVLLGQTALAVSMGMVWPAAIAIGVINSMEALLGAWLFKRWDGRLSLNRGYDLGLLVVLILLVLQPFSATLGTLTLLLSEQITTLEQYIGAWSSWWSGNVMGQLLVTPLLLTLFSQPEKFMQALHSAAKGLILFLAGCVVVLLFKPAANDINFWMLIMLPLVLWITLTGRLAAVSLALTVLSVLTLYLTSQQLGPFVQDGQLLLTEMNIFLLGMILSAMLICWKLEQAELSRQHILSILNTAPVAMMQVQPNGEISWINQVFQRQFGYELTDIPDVQQWLLLAFPDHYKPATLPLTEVEQIKTLLLPTSQIQCRNQQTKDISCSITPLEHPADPGFLITLQDITEQKKQQMQLRISAAAFQTREGIIVTDISGNILKVNQAFQEITGYREADILGKTPKALSSGRHDSLFYQQMWATIKSQGFWEGEIWNQRKNGEIYPENLKITAVKDHTGKTVNYVGVFSDISSSKQAVDEIHNLAFYDPLTRLPNRRLLLDRVKQAAAACQRNHSRGALLFVDIDHFKALNDSMGHDIGDMLLKQVSNRLKSCVRENDTVARFSGDEFVIMLEGLSDNEANAAAQVKIVASKILKVFSRPFQLSGHVHHATSSIGIALFGDQQHKPEEILKRSDIAMYQAKQNGRNSIRFFDPKMQASLSRKMAMEASLHQVLETEQLALHYQIQVDDQDSITGAEALVRWFHPEMGTISPATFIPMAEESGMILPIGDWVLRTACSRLQHWLQQGIINTDFQLSVNVSAKQFRHFDFAQYIMRLIEEYQLPEHCLKLELTESILLENLEDVILIMKQLHETGIQFSLDDFGTGYSSLQYLKQLPLDELKIDQSFTRDIFVDKSDRAIISTIVAMAHSMGLSVIAEGVETREQKEFLQQEQCYRYQGYLFSKPVEEEELIKLLSA